MAYKMADSIGALQREFDAEDQQYADWFKTQASLAQANRAAAMAAQQEALRQAQLQEAYDFQDLQNQQIQKQRALENAMGGRRQLQHEYEFGEKLKAEAAANKLWQENERLRIGEQKAREADRLAQQQQRDYFDLLKDASKGAVPWSALQPVADALPDNLGSEVRAAFAQNELRQAEAQEATKGVAEGWNRELDAIDAQYPENDPSKKFMREQAIKNLRSSIPTGWNKVHRKMPFETVFFESDGRYFPRVSQSQEYQFIQPREGSPGQWDVFPNIMRDRAVPQAAPRPETPTPVPQAAPRAAAPRISEEPSFFGQAATALEATSDMPRMNWLMWARTQQQRTGLKSLGDAISSGAPAAKLTDAAAGAALAPSMGGGTERNAELGLKQARWLADRAKDFVMQKAREVAAGRMALPPGSAMAAPIFAAAKLIQDGMWDAAEKISEQAAEEQLWQHRLDAGGRTVSGDEMLQLTQQAAAEGRL